ncbi:hypothetical protein [Methylomonas methanica]|uniref:Uncharacterized protein n=1 Tax=Methylomonas methanica (strain DSM 25384 / MC09) TaxID=857087 RepID=F9ZZG0_METMM|nr:hypothetical protein [Methylomonas methanica]AEG02353.1 hypothetical protein Metme_4000 [Methylomonas methanica MC09]
MAKSTIDEQIEKWKKTREKGRKSYVIKSWVIPFGFILPVITVFSSTKGIPIKHWGIFVAVFEPLLIGFTVFAGFSSWKYWEKRYERWVNEKKGGPTNLPGTRLPFEKHAQLIVGIYSIPVFVLNLLVFFVAVFVGRNIEAIQPYFAVYSITFFIVFIISFLPILNVMVFVKNPICGHGILSNPDHLHRHPEAEGNYWTNAFKIMKKQPFMCLDCADIYVIEKTGQLVEIIKNDNKI